jgi:hypothetical protein
VTEDAETSWLPCPACGATRPENEPHADHATDAAERAFAKRRSVLGDDDVAWARAQNEKRANPRSTP